MIADRAARESQTRGRRRPAAFCFTCDRPVKSSPLYGPAGRSRTHVAVVPPGLLTRTAVPPVRSGAESAHQSGGWRDAGSPQGWRSRPEAGMGMSDDHVISSGISKSRTESHH